MSAQVFEFRPFQTVRDNVLAAGPSPLHCLPSCAPHSAKVTVAPQWWLRHRSCAGSSVTNRWGLHERPPRSHDRPVPLVTVRPGLHGTRRSGLPLGARSYVVSYEKSDYYTECVDSAADEVGLKLTAEQAKHIGEAVEIAVENVGMAFYSPPASDRYAQIEREWEAKYKALEKEFDKYRGNAEMAVKVALNQHRDAHVAIGEHGEVRRFDGRSDRIQ